MDSLIIAVVTGVVSSVATITAIKVDVAWLKKTQAELQTRISKVENKLGKLWCHTYQ